MLSLLSRSKIRKKIILLFLYNQDKEFYINEIARMVNTSSGTTQRELNKLSENDFVIYSRKGNLVLYRLNKENALLPEIEGIVRKTMGIEFILKEEFADVGNIDFVFIFGSYAKKGFKSQSDIDLYIIGDVDESDFLQKIDSVEQLIQHDINYHLSDKKEFKEKLKKDFFHKEITKNTVLIKGDEHEFKQFVK